MNDRRRGKTPRGSRWLSKTERHHWPRPARGRPLEITVLITMFLPETHSRLLGPGPTPPSTPLTPPGSRGPQLPAGLAAGPLPESRAEEPGVGFFPACLLCPRLLMAAAPPRSQASVSGKNRAEVVRSPVTWPRKSQASLRHQVWGRLASCSS